MYTKEQVLQASKDYFHGDVLAANTFLKYALSDGDVYYELTPKDMHERLAKEIHRKESEYPNPLSYETILKALTTWKIIPGGSILYGLGNPYSKASCSNCVTVASPRDSLSSIYSTARDMACLYSRRAGVGVNISTLRPDGEKVSNAAKTSTGAWSFADIYAYIAQHTAQCLHEDTLIMTSKGLKQIKNISSGESVWTKDGWVVVDDVVTNQKECLEIRTIYGHGLICSEDHVIHTPTGEIKAGDLVVGQKITQILGRGWDGQEITLIHSDYQRKGFNQSNRLVEVSYPQILSNDLSYFLGFMYGNGYVTEDVVSVSSYYESLVLRCSTILSTEFGVNPPKVFKKSGESCYSMRLGSILVSKFLSDNGFSKHPSSKIDFPISMFSAKESVIKAFICGFFDADGTVIIEKKTYKMSSVSEQFLISIQNILSSFGIVSKLHKMDRTKQGWQSLYDLVINGRESQKRFREFMKGSYKVNNFLFKKKKADRTKTIYMSRDFGVAPTSKYNYVSKGSMSFSTLNRLGKDIGFNPLDYPLLEDEIISIKKLDGIYNTYDLVLPTEHKFWANGLYVHNSGRRGALICLMDISHPDIFKFVTMKKDVTRVTGANISVLVSDAFMEALKKNEPWDLEFGGKVYQTVSSRELWNLIVETATQTAEPGLIFWDTYKRLNPLNEYKHFKMVGVNPCCFAVDCNVPVVTKNGIKDIKDVTCDDMIWVPRHKAWAKTSGYFMSGPGNVYRIKFSNGTELDVTSNHKFETLKYQRIDTICRPTIPILKELKDINIGDLVSVPIESPLDGLELGDKGTYGEGLVLGWLGSDGCLTYQKSTDAYPSIYLPFWEQKYSCLDPVLNVVKNEMNIPIGYMQAKNYENNIRVICSSSITSYLTNKYHLNIWKFKEGYNEFLYEASLDFIKGYLSAYFSADGTTTNSKNPSSKNFAIQLSSIDKERLIQIRNLLLLFGIKSSIGIGKNEGKSTIRGIEYSTKTLYRITITGNSNLVRFRDYIGFIHIGKAKLLNDALDTLDLDRLAKLTTYCKVVSIEPLGVKETGCIEVEDCHTFIADGVISGNSELGLSENGACMLGSLNLQAFVVRPHTPDAYFDFPEFIKHTGILTRVMDDLIDLEVEALDKVIAVLDPDARPVFENIKKVHIEGRRVGIGITGLADCLASCGLRYDDSLKARDRIKEIFTTLRNETYKTSIKLATERGTFPAFNWQTERENMFIQSLPQDLINKMSVSGRRNGAMLTCPPAGSISILAQVSNGIEPVFANSYIRRKKVSHSGETVDSVDSDGIGWHHYEVWHKNITDYQAINHTKDLPNYFITADKIDWHERVKIQGLINGLIDHGSSSTVNLPRNTLSSIVGELYEMAWSEGVKGLTVYVEGSRDGVMLRESPIIPNWYKRPEELDCHIYREEAMHHGETNLYIVLVGLRDGIPYEVFGGLEAESGIPKDIKEGFIIKKPSKSGNRYELRVDGDKVVSSLGATFTDGPFNIINRLVSMGLRFAPDNLPFVVDQLNKEKSFVGWAKVLSRILKRYIIPGTDSSSRCPQCGEKTLRYEGGCNTCTSCGFSGC